jgi:hypothetical protein
MTNSLGKVLFLLNLTVLGIVVALAAHQVPQPWRGILVGWLFVALTLGSLVVKALKHYFEHQAARPSQPVATRHPAPRRSHRHRQFEGLEVVYSDHGGSGRHVIR